MRQTEVHAKAIADAEAQEHAFEPTRVRTLQDHGAVIRAHRARGNATGDLVARVLRGVAVAFASELRAGRLVVRFQADDIVYDAELDAFAVAADVERHDPQQPLSRITLLDNGIYAPELTGQINRALSHRTTVYGAAAILYYVITGLEPIPGFSLLADNLPPARIFEPGLPFGVDPVLRRAVSREPDHRYADPAAFLEAIECALAIDTLRCAADPSPPLRIRYAAATHPGLNKSEKNPENQDKLYSAYDRRLGLGLFVVADGVSHCDLGSGDRAAGKVVEAAHSVWKEITGEPRSELPPARRSDASFIGRFQQILAHANEAVVAETNAVSAGAITPQSKVMSTTMVAAFINGRRAIIANVGDSRVYIIRDRYIDQITVDMDRRTSALLQGQGLDAILNGSRLGQLTAAVGTCSFEASRACLAAEPVPCQFFTTNLLAGDRLLICSDGVPDCIGEDSERRIHQTALASDRPSKIAWDLLVAANQRGGDDNITAILVVCSGTEDYYG